MPHYTFTVSGDGHSTTADLRDHNAAWIEAIHLAGEMLRDIKGDLPSDTGWEISVTDEGGQPVATVRIQAQRHLPLG